MPSPFPRIDPYLESQGYWPDFHASLTTYCRDALNDVLPESSEARLGEQLRLVERREPQGRTVLPDVSVLTPEPVTIDLPVEEIEEMRDLWSEIRHRLDRDLVTAIEILSPTNKLGVAPLIAQYDRCECSEAINRVSQPRRFQRTLQRGIGHVTVRRDHNRDHGRRDGWLWFVSGAKATGRQAHQCLREREDRVSVRLCRVSV